MRLAASGEIESREALWEALVGEAGDCSLK